MSLGVAAPPLLFPVFKEALYLHLGKTVAEEAHPSSSSPPLPLPLPTETRVAPRSLDRWFARALVQTVSENERLVTHGDILNLALLPVDQDRVERLAVDHHLDHLRFVDRAHRDDKRRLLSGRRDSGTVPEAVVDSGDSDGRRDGTTRGRGKRGERAKRGGGSGARETARTTAGRKSNREEEKEGRERGAEDDPRHRGSIRTEALETEESEWARFSDRVARLVEHFGEAVRRCGHRLTSEVLRVFRKIHGAPVGKRDLARLVALHAPSKATAASKRTSKRGKTEQRRDVGKPRRGRARPRGKQRT